MWQDREEIPYEVVSTTVLLYINIKILQIHDQTPIYQMNSCKYVINSDIEAFNRLNYLKISFILHFWVNLFISNFQECWSWMWWIFCFCTEGFWSQTKIIRYFPINSNCLGIHVPLTRHQIHIVLWMRWMREPGLPGDERTEKVHELVPVQPGSLCQD